MCTKDRDCHTSLLCMSCDRQPSNHAALGGEGRGGEGRDDKAVDFARESLHYYKLFVLVRMCFAFNGSLLYLLISHLPSWLSLKQQ